MPERPLWVTLITLLGWVGLLVPVGWSYQNVWRLGPGPWYYVSGLLLFYSWFFLGIALVLLDTFSKKGRIELVIWIAAFVLCVPGLVLAYLLLFDWGWFTRADTTWHYRRALSDVLEVVGLIISMLLAPAYVGYLTLRSVVGWVRFWRSTARAGTQG